MNNFRYKFSQFMQGRYGTDQLYYALLVLYLILLVLNMFFRKLLFFNILSWVVFIFAFYRVFSLDTFRRGKENAVFLNLWDKLRGLFGRGGSSRGFSGFNGYNGSTGSSQGSGGPTFIDKMRDFPKKKYVTCPKCKAAIRVPRQRGKHTVRCPRCGERFGVHIVIGSKN